MSTSVKQRNVDVNVNVNVNVTLNICVSLLFRCEFV